MDQQEGSDCIEEGIVAIACNHMAGARDHMDFDAGHQRTHLLDADIVDNVAILSPQNQGRKIDTSTNGLKLPIAVVKVLSQNCRIPMPPKAPVLPEPHVPEQAIKIAGTAPIGIIGSDGLGYGFEAFETVRICAHEVADAARSVRIWPRNDIDKDERPRRGCDAVADCEKGGEPSHRCADEGDWPSRRVDDRLKVSGLRFDRIVRIDSPVAFAVPARIEADHAVAETGEMGSASLPRVARLPSAMEKYDGRCTRRPLDLADQLQT